MDTFARATEDDDLGYHAETSTDIAPDFVPQSEYGPHRSEVFSVGGAPQYRRWSFQTAQARDKFIRAVGAGMYRRD